MASYQQHYDSVLLDAGLRAPVVGAAAAAAVDDELESVGLLRDDSHVAAPRLSFGSESLLTLLANHVGRWL